MQFEQFFLFGLTLILNLVNAKKLYAALKVDSHKILFYTLLGTDLLTVILSFLAPAAALIVLVVGIFISFALADRILPDFVPAKQVAIPASSNPKPPKKRKGKKKRH